MGLSRRGERSTIEDMIRHSRFGGEPTKIQSHPRLSETKKVRKNLRFRIGIIPAHRSRFPFFFTAPEGIPKLND